MVLILNHRTLKMLKIHAKIEANFIKHRKHKESHKTWKTPRNHENIRKKHERTCKYTTETHGKPLSNKCSAHNTGKLVQKVQIRGNALNLVEFMKFYEI